VNDDTPLLGTSGAVKVWPSSFETTEKIWQPKDRCFSGAVFVLFLSLKRGVEQEEGG